MNIHKNPTKSRYEFYLDLSGTLKRSRDDIYIGCVLIPDLYKSPFRDKFYREFPSLRSFKKKGTSLDPNKLKQIISYMDEQKIKMCCVVLKRHILKQIERDLKEKFSNVKNVPKEKVSLRFFEERTIASVYFYALSQYAWRGYPYNCFSCMETQFDIQQSFVALSRISYNRGFHFKVACIPRRTEHMIKFADFVASAGRRLDKFIIDRYTNFKFISYRPDDEHLNIAFNLSRQETQTNRNVYKDTR